MPVQPSATARKTSVRACREAQNPPESKGGVDRRSSFDICVRGRTIASDTIPATSATALRYKWSQPGPLVPPKSQRTDLERTVMALRLAAMYAIPARFSDGLAHCMEASVAGVGALRRRNIDARVIPCALLGVQVDRGIQIAVGLTAHEVYERLDRSRGPMPTRDSWMAKHSGGFPDPSRMVSHAVVEARFRGRRAFIDLTAGQLRQNFGVPLPVAIARFGEGWPTIDVGGWRLEYVPSPRAAEVEALCRAYDGGGFIEDMDALIDVALDCDLDPALMQKVLGMSQPDLVARVVDRLQGVMDGPAPALGLAGR